MAATVMLGITGASAGTQYLAQRKQGEYESGQMDVNAGLADTQAADAIARGKEAAGRQQMGVRGLIGSQRTALAAQGLETDSGTAANLQSDTAQLGELDRLQIEHNAAREAFGYKVDPANTRARGEQVRSSSRNAARTTLLTAASQLYAMKASGDAASPPKSKSMISTRGWGG